MLAVKLTEAEELVYRFDVDQARIEEGLQVLQMFSKMPSKVEDGSVWHVISTKWIKVW